MPIIRKAEELDTEYLFNSFTKKIFEDYTPKKIASRTYESIKISTDGLTIKLIDKNQRDLLSIVHGNIRTYKNVRYFEIICTYSKLERRGYLTYLFEILVYELNNKILSDSQHSCPGAKEFWQALIRRNKFNIYRLNLETNFKRKAIKFKENEIWRETPMERFDSFLNDWNYFEDDNIELDDDSDEIDFDLKQFDEELDITDNTSEDLKIERNNWSLKIENIRLIAQRYVG